MKAVLVKFMSLSSSAIQMGSFNVCLSRLCFCTSIGLFFYGFLSSVLLIPKILSGTSAPRSVIRSDCYLSWVLLVNTLIHLRLHLLLKNCVAKEPD